MPTPGSRDISGKSSMRTCRHDESGETLVEILVAMIVIGIVVGALFATIATASTASKSQKDFVAADVALRSYGELTKEAVRAGCPGLAGKAFTVPYTAPPGSTIVVTAIGLTCPSPTSVGKVDITAALPGGATKKLSVNVRTP